MQNARRSLAGDAPVGTPGTGVSLAITLAIQSLAAAAVIVPTAIAPAILHTLGFPATSVGLYVAIVYLGAVVSTVLGGQLVLHLGAIRASQFALALGACGLALLATRSSLLAVLGAVLIGFGYGPITPASSQVLARTTPARRMNLVFSIKQTGVPVGGFLAGILAPSLTVLVGWQGALVAFGAASLACAALAQPLRASLDTDRKPGAAWGSARSLLRPIAVVWRDRLLRALAMCSFVFTIVQMSVTGFTVTYLTGQLGWSLVAAGVALSVAQVAGVVGRIVWGWVGDSGHGVRRTLVGLCVAMIASGVATLAMTPATPFGAVWMLLAVYGASAIGWNGLFIAAIARCAGPAQASIATGGTLGFTFFGVVVGSPLFALLAGATGDYSIAFAALALPLLACLPVLRRIPF